MGSSKGSSSGTQHYNGTIACVQGIGPIYALDAILLGGEQVWSGPLYRSGATGPVNLSTEYGTLRWYWGTESQPADPLLNKYEEHPPYKGLGYLVFCDYDHGQSPNAYNVEVIYRRAPQQSVVTGSVAAESLDDARSANAVVAACEVLTSPYWLGLAAADLVAATFQEVAEATQAEIPSGGSRSAAAVSPLWADATDARTALLTITAQADIWLRINTAGKVECGRWRRDAAPASVTTLTWDDLTETPTVDLDDDEEVPNSYAVEIVDSTALFKDAKVIVDDQAKLVGDGRLIRKTIKADHLITADQGLRAGQEALRRVGRGTWSGQVRWSKARTPAGARLQPGDYLRVPWTQPGEEASATQLVRITKTVWPKNATDAVQIEADIDSGAAPIYGTATTGTGTVTSTGVVMPPVVAARVLSLPATTSGGSPTLHALAARPHGLALGVDVYYDDTASGDFPVVGKQRAFALPVSISTAAAADAGTIRVALLAAGANGEDFRRDEHILRDWSGGLTEGRNDELLLILIKRGSGGAIAANGDRDYVEICAVSGAPTLVSTDTFDVPVLRGRRETVALAWETATTEAWLIPLAQLASLEHADFDGMLSTGSTGYFRLGAYASRSTYSPAAAFAELERRQALELSTGEYADQPDDATWVPAHIAKIPAGYAETVIVDGGQL